MNIKSTTDIYFWLYREIHNAKFHMCHVAFMEFPAENTFGNPIDNSDITKCSEIRKLVMDYGCVKYQGPVSI